MGGGDDFEGWVIGKLVVEVEGEGCCGAGEGYVVEDEAEELVLGGFADFGVF